MAAVAFRRPLSDRDHIHERAAPPLAWAAVHWRARTPLWRLRPGMEAPKTKPHPLALILVASSHMALYGLLLTGTLASWWLAVPHPGDGSRGASQGALVLSSAAIAQPRPVPQTDIPTPVTVSELVTPPPPMLRVSTIHIRTPPARPRTEAGTPSTVPAKQAAATPESGSQGMAGNQTDRRNVDTGRSGNQGGGHVQPASYEAEVLAWINRHKRYPRDAIVARQEGIVGIAVELDRWGRLLRVELLNSSGHHSLDQAALRQVRAAAPYPRPVDADWNRKRIELNLDFSLRDVRAD